MAKVYVTAANYSAERVNEDANVYGFELNNTQQLLLDFIKKNNRINRIEAEKVTGLKKTYTVEILNNLMRAD